MSEVRAILQSISPACRQMFDEETEADFKKDYNENSLPAVRIAFLTGFIIFSVFALLDYFSTSASFYKILIIRLAIICPIIIAAYILTYTIFIQKHLQPFMFTCSLMAGSGVLAMIYVLQPDEPAFYFYYSGVLLVIMWSYTISRLRYTYAAISTWVMFILYNVIAIKFKHVFSYSPDSISFKAFININFFLISFNIVGMALGLTVEYYHKKEFILRARLKKAHIKIKDEIAERIKNDETIRSLLNEKEFILKEVHHRIKNNMCTIIAFLNLQTDTIDEPSAVAAINDAESRVRSMMVLYDKLYLSENCNNIQIKEYLPALIDEIIQNFPNSRSVTINKQIDDIILGAKHLSLIGIIINELLTNIMKYAFNGRADGIINTSALLKDNMIHFIIQDNGIGLPESISPGSSAGFGFKLIEMLTNQLSGTMRIERDNGTRFTFEFDLQRLTHTG